MKKVFFILVLLVIFSTDKIFSQITIDGSDMMAVSQKTVSLDLEKAKMVDVLKMLSQQTGLNFVTTEAVRDREITLYMDKVPLKKAMDLIFEANNLAYAFYPESKAFIVKEMGRPSIELMTKIYRLNYVRVSGSRLQKEVEDKMGSSGSESGGLKSAVEGVLSEVGKIIEDSATNSLIVIDVPSQFKVIDDVVRKLDIPNPAVMISVEMLDVSKSKLDKMGFKFENGLYAKYVPGARSSYFPFRRSLLKNAESQLEGTASASADETNVSSSMLGILDLRSFTTIMQFLTEETSTKFIARPKILTLSNETAEVNITAHEAIGVTTTENESGGITQDVEREETGTKLRVTPNVNPLTNEITLFIEMFNKGSVDSGLRITGMTEGNIKNIEERATKNIVRLEDGETLLISGLIRKYEGETKRKIPMLGDIPLLGGLFRYREKPGSQNRDRELLVFVTPKVINKNTLLIGRQKKPVLREQVNRSKRKAVKKALGRFLR